MKQFQVALPDLFGSLRSLAQLLSIVDQLECFPDAVKLRIGRSRRGHRGDSSLQIGLVPPADIFEHGIFGLAKYIESGQNPRFPGEWNFGVQDIHNRLRARAGSAEGWTI